MARITFHMTTPDGLQRMSDDIIAGLNWLIEEAIKGTYPPKKKAKKRSNEETAEEWVEEPEKEEPSGGRLLVLGERFLDPYHYRKGKEITVAGEILGEKTRPLGKMEYRYPLLLSKQIYLWRKHPYYYPPPYYPYDPRWYDRYDDPRWYDDPWE